MAERRFMPETPEAITADWLNEVLTDHPQFSSQIVTGVESEVIGDGEGFVGDILRLTLQMQDDHHPRTMVAKLPKLENRAVGELLGAYEREIMFYRSFAEELPIRTAGLIHADFDRDRGSENQEEILRRADALPRWLNGATAKLGRWIAAAKKRRYILLIEDVAPAVPGNQLEGASRKRCRQVLRELAALHARFWDADALHGHFWLLPSDIDVRMRHTMMKDSREAFARSFGATAERLAPSLDALTDTGVELLQGLCAGPNTLLHNDMRLDNLLFDADGAIFIDWQLVRRGPAMIDVAYFLASAVTDEEPAHDLIETYHEALASHGIHSYPLDRAMADYRSALQVVLMSLSTVDSVDVGSGRGDELLKTWMIRLAQRLEADT